MIDALLIQMDVQSSAYFTQTASLSGQTFTFKFLWNERDKSFYMDVQTNDGVKRSIRMVPGRPLLGNSQVTDRGDFYLLSEDSKADPDNIEYEQYGKMWNLFWVPNAEE